MGAGALAEIDHSRTQPSRSEVEAALAGAAVESRVKLTAADRSRRAEAQGKDVVSQTSPAETGGSVKAAAVGPSALSCPKQKPALAAHAQSVGRVGDAVVPQNDASAVVDGVLRGEALGAPAWLRLLRAGEVVWPGDVIGRPHEVPACCRYDQSARAHLPDVVSRKYCRATNQGVSPRCREADSVALDCAGGG